MIQNAFISAKDLYCPLTHTSSAAHQDPHADYEGKHLEISTLYSSTTAELLFNWQNSSGTTKSNDEPQTIHILGLYYCQIVTLTKEAFDSQISEQYHLTLFKLFWT